VGSVNDTAHQNWHRWPGDFKVKHSLAVFKGNSYRKIANCTTLYKQYSYKKYGGHLKITFVVSGVIDAADHQKSRVHCQISHEKYILCSILFLMCHLAVALYAEAEVRDTTITTVCPLPPSANLFINSCQKMRHMTPTICHNKRWRPVSFFKGTVPRKSVWDYYLGW
jgi:hypothetical protein